MNTITKSAIGLTLTGGATAAIVFAALPAKQTTRTRAEILAERQAKKVVSFRVLANLFNKYEGEAEEEVSKEVKKLGKIIEGTEAGGVIFKTRDKNSFYDDGPVETALSTWCVNNNWNPEKTTHEYEQELKRDKDAICAFAKIMADSED